MKTYKVKNYKGNLIESLSKFQKNHKGMKIVEAKECDEELKIKAKESTDDQEVTQADKDFDMLATIEQIIEILGNSGAYYQLSKIDSPSLDERNKFYQACYDFFSNLANNKEILAKHLEPDELQKLKREIQDLKA